MDDEAGQQFEMLDEGALQIQEDFAGSLQQEVRHISGQQSETQDLAERVLKLEMQVGHLTLDRKTHLESGIVGEVQKQSAPSTSGIGSQV